MNVLKYLLAGALAALPVLAQAPKIDPNLPSYRPVSGLKGDVTIVGSETLQPIVEQWFSAFRKLHPDVALKAIGQGSTAGHLALMEGTSLIGSMSREMTKPEQAAFESKYGYQPVRLVVGLDAVVVFTHPANPVPALTLEQVDAIYSASRKRGLGVPITTWGQAGATGELANRKISLYGRDEDSGTRAFFKEKVLLKGEFRPGINAMTDPSSMLESVSLDAAGIGYGSFGDLVSLVKAVPIVNANGVRVIPTAETILKGDYPLTRFLYFYVNRAPGKPLPPAVSAFLNFVYSREGQLIMASCNLPVPADVCKAMNTKVQ